MAYKFGKLKISLPLVGVILLYFGLPLLSFADLIFNDQTLYWSDLSWIHYPRHIFAAREWLAGRVPLWDPYQHLGLPFLAESQVGALYLFSAIFLLPLSPSLELSLYIMLHCSLAALFTYLLARSLGMDYAPATIAGLGFGFGGFLMAQIPNLNIMTGAVWLPLILFGAIQTLKYRRWSVAMAAGIPIALQILTAQPQIVLYSLVTAMGYSIYRIIADTFTQTTSNPRQTIHLVALSAIPLVTGVLLAAPQWLATRELQQLSVRSTDLGLDFLVKNSLPPVMFLNLVLPGLFGNNVTGFKGGDPFQEDFVYIGVTALVFVFFSGRQLRKKDMLFFLLLLVGGIIMAVGDHTPFYEGVVQYLPGFSLFRIPSRWLMVVNLSLAILAGYGLQNILENGVSKPVLLAIPLIITAMVVWMGFLWVYQEQVSNWVGANLGEYHTRLLAAYYSNSYIPHPAYSGRLAQGWLVTPGPRLLLGLPVIVGAIWLYTIRKLRSTTFSIIVVLVVALDVGSAGGTTLHPTKPTDWWHQLSGGAQHVLDNLEETRVFPLGMGSEALAVSHFGHYFPSVYQVRSAGGHGSSLMIARIGTFLDSAHPVQAIRVLGVRYILTQGMMSADAAATFPITFADDESFVYENSRPIPRALLVHQVVAATSPDEALTYFESAELDPTRTVVIEGSNLPPPTQPTQPGQAEITRETPQVVEITTESDADGYLVLLDSYYPGWKATVDDNSTQLYRANYLVRAVFVPAGRHIVRFEYQPAPFRTGVWLALGTSLSFGIVIFFEKRFIRKRVKHRTNAG
jgi:hypothetical protein